MNYEVRNVRFGKGSLGPSVTCSLYHDKQRIAVFYDKGNRGRGTFADWKSVEENAFKAFVMRQPLLGDKPSVFAVETVMAALIMEWDMRRQAKSRTQFREARRKYKEDVWDAFLKPYSRKLRANIEAEFGKCIFRVDEPSCLIP